MTGPVPIEKMLPRLLWILLSGVWFFLYYLICGVALCASVIGIPFGLKMLTLAVTALAPQDKAIAMDERGFYDPLRMVLNILWVLLFGLGFAVLHLVFALIFMLTVVGFPFARHHTKLSLFALMPFGWSVQPNVPSRHRPVRRRCRPVQGPLPAVS